MQRRCAVCGAKFAAKRATAQYCSAQCGKVAHREKRCPPPPAADLVSVPAGDDLYEVSDGINLDVVVALSD